MYGSFFMINIFALNKVPSITQWIKTNLKPGDLVSADPKLVSADLWLQWLSDLGDDTNYLNCLILQ